MAAQSFTVHLGPANTGQAYADYTLAVFDAAGAAVVTTGWTWLETARGGYVVTIPTAAPGGSYDLYKTAGETPWKQGEVPSLMARDIAAIKNRTRGLLISAEGFLNHPVMLQVFHWGGSTAMAPPAGSSLALYCFDEETGVSTLIGTQSYGGVSVHDPDLWVGNPSFVGPAPAGTLLQIIASGFSGIPGGPAGLPAQPCPDPVGFLSPDITGDEEWIMLRLPFYGEKFFVSCDGQSIRADGMKGSSPVFNYFDLAGAASASGVAASTEVKRYLLENHLENSQYIFLDGADNTQAGVLPLSLVCDVELPAGANISVETTAGTLCSVTLAEPWPANTPLVFVKDHDDQIPTKERLCVYVSADVSASNWVCTVLESTDGNNGNWIGRTYEFAVPAIAGSLYFYPAVDGGLIANGVPGRITAPALQSTVAAILEDTGTTIPAAIAGISAGSGLSAQETRDAMKLAPTAGDPAAGSVDAHLDTIVANPGTGASAETILAGVAGLLAGDILPSAMQARAVTVGAVPRTIPRGDVFTLTFTLGADIDISGTRKAFLIAKKSKVAANSTAIVNRECTISDRAAKTGYITLTAAETATIGSYHVEIEVTDADETSNPQTAYAETWAIAQDVRQ